MLDWLKAILGDNYTEEIDGKIAAEIGKQFVARADFNTLNETKKTLEKTVNDLKASNGDNQALQNTIKTHEATIAKLQKDAENAKKTYAVKEQLRSLGVTDPDYIIYKQGGIDKFTFDKDGVPEKLDDILKAYRENAAMSHLFSSGKQDYNPAVGKTSVTNPFAKETYNLTEQGKLLRDNPAEAKELAAAAGITLNI